ncbi:hypothetical protein M8J77_024745 [Diaphorina citri]|nr:hypothetical protein M8J77_024745 [Diaphorina citri]
MVGCLSCYLAGLGTMIFIGACTIFVPKLCAKREPDDCSDTPTKSQRPSQKPKSPGSSSVVHLVQYSKPVPEKKRERPNYNDAECDEELPYGRRDRDTRQRGQATPTTLTNRIQRPADDCIEGPYHHQHHAPRQDRGRMTHERRNEGRPMPAVADCIEEDSDICLDTFQAERRGHYDDC